MKRVIYSESAVKAGSAGYAESNLVAEFTNSLNDLCQTAHTESDIQHLVHDFMAKLSCIYQGNPNVGIQDAILICYDTSTTKYTQVIREYLNIDDGHTYSTKFVADTMAGLSDDILTELYYELRDIAKSDDDVPYEIAEAFGLVQYTK